MIPRGPLVRRSARIGGWVFALGSLQFVGAMIAVQAAYPGYSDLANYVSDLGNPTLSPWAGLFNASIELLGAMGVIGTILVRSAFPPKRSARGGLFVLAIASLGAIGVGLFPETAPELGGRIHDVVSLVVFVASGVALLLLGVAMVRDTRWDGFRGFTALAGLVTLVALAVYVGGGMNGDLAGLIERVVIAPILLWAIVAGAHLGRLAVYAPEAARRRPLGY
ncbi:MAG TPA: DUF998 domain-containing protein [Thermoplasmata archaeon]|nr:DUF998 domain-containing protein [Thermoplasmata archaeon]